MRGCLSPREIGLGHLNVYHRVQKRHAAGQGEGALGKFSPLEIPRVIGGWGGHNTNTSCRLLTRVGKIHAETLPSADVLHGGDVVQTYSIVI